MSSGEVGENESNDERSSLSEEESKKEVTVSSSIKKETSDEKTKEENSFIKKYLIPALLILVIIGSLYVVYIKKFAPQPGLSEVTLEPTQSAPVKNTVQPSLTASLKGNSPSPTPALTVKEPEVNGLEAVYYDDLNFAGKTASRLDKSIDFEWAQSPIEGIEPDTFSIRWSGYLLAPVSGNYTFYTKVDDGVRFYINGRQIINEWRENGLSEFSTTTALTAGKIYPLKLEMFDKNGAAKIQLFWSTESIQKQIIPTKYFLLSKIGTGINGTYYDDTNFSKEVAKRRDGEINFALKEKPPHDKLTQSQYSVRWEGMLNPKYNQLYTFYVKANGGIRIWIDNKLVLDRLEAKTLDDYQFDVQLSSETLVNFKVEYVHIEGDNTLNIQWESRSQKIQSIPATRLYS